MKHYLEELIGRRMRAYREDPGLLKEHFAIEQTVLAGGYGYRQIVELVQNGADAILEAQQERSASGDENRIQVLLKGDRLYVANTGAPLSKEGLDTLLGSHYSSKRGNQIGRFGLGFKSLLRLGGRIDIFTRNSGAFRFDPTRCQEELRNRFGIAETPRLRLAWSLEDGESSDDAVLTSLDWAETIVRVEVPSVDLQDHLFKEMRAFPPEFLLFFSVLVALTLEDGREEARNISLTQDGDQYALHDGAHVSRWRLIRREVSVTDRRALDDATFIHARDKVPLDWAVPVDGRREEAGRFWAFFPTQTPTYLPGILNAPWKLNSDRNAVIGGEWNTALMVEAARLIAESLPALATGDDPGRPIEAFPRQMDSKDEVAAPLVDVLWRNLTTAAVVADATGSQRVASGLRRHPRDSAELARLWRSIASTERRAAYVHPACLERQRGSRLNALAALLSGSLSENTTTVSRGPMLRRSEAMDWFADVASTDLPTAALVLRLAESYKGDCKPTDWEAVRGRLAIIPAQDGQLVTAGQALLAPEGTVVPGHSAVATALCSDPDIRRILVDVMGVRTPDNKVWLEVLTEALAVACSYASSEITSRAWQDFWAVSRQVPEPVREQFFRNCSGKIRIRRRDGSWVCADEVLLPGRLIAADDTSANGNLLIDGMTHGGDEAALRVLGVAEMPEGQVALQSFVQVGDWLWACRGYYKAVHQNPASPEYLAPRQVYMPRGFSLLACLKGGPNTYLTRQFMSQIVSDAFRVPVQFGHRTMRAYPEIEVPHPLLWLIARFGSVQIGNETVRVAVLMAKRRESALQMLPGWDEWVGALAVLEETFPKVAPAQEDIADLWRAAMAVAVTPESIASDDLANLWMAAALDGIVPDSLPSTKGAVPISDLFVTDSPDLAARARRTSRVVILLDSTTLAKWVDHGATDLAGLFEPTWSEQTGPIEQLVVAIPELHAVMHADHGESAMCQPVSGLAWRFKDSSETVACLMWQGRLLLDLHAWGSQSRSERLGMVVREIAPAGWLDCSCDDALIRLGTANVDARRAHVAEGKTLPARLLRAAGNRREPLLEALGGFKDSAFVKRCTTPQLAEVVLAQAGPSVLAILRKTLEDEGLDPPTRWNTPDARAFVASIGFPVEFASSPESRRESEDLVSGPIDLPPLHDFQEEVMKGLETLFAGGRKRRRAVVSLPTGGGKTRVTVESAVRLILVPPGDRRSVIWIAQTDELCEQAVQAFRQVWLNVGAQRTDLRIVRLWGGNPNPTIRDMDRPVVIVASIQTLNSRMGTQDLIWLRKPGMVVVDECHHAITPSYSNLLRWLYAEAPRPGAAEERDEPPIIGLSATPFRTDDDESRRLARRFDNRWFPADQHALHARLLAQGVLARAEYEALQSGTSLSEDEIRLLAELPDPWEGLVFDRLLESINQRLGGDEKRSERLVWFIRRCPEKSILLFANSVLHAEEMSARLNLTGVVAAAVSAKTPMVARRYFLEHFQRGDVRVLCNDSVLGTGFDAPKTDMIMIARQVFSPVRYMQMVGRGLRGERNGGTARCRIVTVLDNLGRFADRHPYHYCQQYFSAT